MKIQNNFHRFLAVIAAGMSLAGHSAFAQTYTWTTIAGLGTAPGAVDGTGSAARFYEPFGIAQDGAGNLLVTDYGNNLIRKLTPIGTNWMVTTILGGGKLTHDGAGTNSTFSSPSGITALSAGQFEEVEGSYNQLGYMRQIMLTNNVWSVTTLHVGGSVQGALTGGQPNGAAADAFGEVFVAIANGPLVNGDNGIELTFPQGVNWASSLIAGSGAAGTTDGTNTAALFYAPQGITVDALGNVYVADTGNNTIRRLALDPINPNWITTTIAGQAGVAGFLDGTNGAILFNAPDGIAVDGSGNLFIADAGNNAIRELSPQGTNWIARTIGGQLNRTHGTADGVGTAASFFHPMTPMVDSLGRIFVADYANNTIRMGVPSLVTNPPPVVQMATAGNSAFVIWPSSASAMVLQTTTNITSGNWQTVTVGITTNLVFSGPMTNGQAFYRLQQQ